MRNLCSLFRWRQTVASTHGPRSSISRHVLLTLGLHMDTNGLCFPSSRLLSDETALTRRTVEAHLRKCAKEGWITRKHAGTSKGWRRYIYQLSYPPGIDGELDLLRQSVAGEHGSPPQPMGGELGSPPEPHGGESDAIIVAKDVPTNSPVNPSLEDHSAFGDAVPIHEVTNPEAAPGRNGGHPPTGYRTKKGRILQGECLTRFNEFWRTFQYSKGKAEAADAWYDLWPIDAALFESILNGAQREAKQRPDVLVKGLTPKWAQGWLSGRRWEDEDEPAQNHRPSRVVL